ncbi:restriction endonuclease subunit S [Pseudomonas sp. DE0157]|uniref:restriction endonuclease subunit S n=1 Tax=Pseudomonas sp. DE0157 TaxID=2584952 RepID=UPI0011A40783|nr:restriction endonuclease subunit S [Pseudomonas sp. DE0157]
MSSKLYRLDDLLEVTSSKRIHMVDYVSSGVPFYRGKEVIERSKGNAISTELFITSEQYQGIKRKFGSPQDGDILLTSVGTLGVPYYVSGDGDFYFKDGNVTWFRDFSSKIDSKFLFYWLSSSAVQQRLDEISIGSTQRALTISALKSLEIELPDLPTQKIIVEVLDAVTDRITLLRGTNATLEAIAQALFKSWFVDFEPVRAKAEGLEPEGLDAATSALFPDSFEESELGLVPRGWKAGCVADIASQKKGSVNPLASPNELFEHYSLPAFDNGQSPVLERGESIKSNKTPLPEDAVLLSKLNPHIPRVWLPVRHGKNAVCSTEFLAYSPTAASSKELIYCLFNSAEFQQQLCQLVTGTSNSHQRVKPDQVLKLRLAIADDSLYIAFSDIAFPIFERVYANRLKIQTLTQIRDILLPRLISGQLRLPEDEAQIEAVCA